MAKKSEKKEDLKKTLALIFVEGDTEVDFYNKMKEHLRHKLGGKLACEVKIHNLKGVGQYQNTAQRIFEKRIKVDYPPEEYRYHVFLCYDTDVFEYAKKPPVDWSKVIKMLKELGAHEVLRVEAKTSIEDWFLLDMSGERLFNMERAYRIKCTEAVSEIEEMKIISDPKMFRSTATSGQNPRRFAAFSKSKLQLLTEERNREKAAKYFKIPLTDDNRFDTSQKVDAENLVKVLCGKAMWDVLEEVPVEVDGSKGWGS